MQQKKDVKLIRDLAARVAEIATKPVQEEKREMWHRFNALEPVRPMVMIDRLKTGSLDILGDWSMDAEKFLFPNNNSGHQNL